MKAIIFFVLFVFAILCLCDAQTYIIIGTSRTNYGNTFNLGIEANNFTFSFQTNNLFNCTNYKESKIPKSAILSKENKIAGFGIGYYFNLIDKIKANNYHNIQLSTKLSYLIIYDIYKDLKYCYITNGENKIDLLMGIRYRNKCYSVSINKGIKTKINLTLGFNIDRFFY